MMFCIISGITFDTQITLAVVDPELLGSEKDNVADPKNTGVYVYN